MSLALIGYELDDGDVVEEVCYWRDMTFFPHAVNLTSKRGVRAQVRFTSVENPGADRKYLARQLREEMMRLKQSTTS